MSLQDVVKLYRESGCPSIENSIFSGEFNASDENKKLFNAIQTNNQYGRISSAEVNGHDLLMEDVELLPTDNIRFRFRLANNSSDKFYNNFSSLLSSHKLLQGEMPNSFYIIDKDLYYSIDQDESDCSKYFEQLKIIGLFIKSLSELAHYHDSKVIDSKNKLVFLSSDEKQSHPVVLEVDLHEELLDCNLDDLTLLTSLISSEAALDSHYLPRKNILYSSLYEFLQGLDPKQAFKKLALNWNGFADVFQKNLSTYLSGFAFHKAKKEIAEAEIKLAEQLSKITSELIGKLFSIPASLAAVIAMFHKDSSITTNLLIVFGLLITAIIIVGIVRNQKCQLESIKQSKRLINQSIQGEKDSYPEELKNEIGDMTRRLDGSIKTASNWLLTFRILAWIPALIGAATLVFIYKAQWFLSF